jgi:hypothetical protein
LLHSTNETARCSSSLTASIMAAKLRGTLCFLLIA